MSPLQPYNYTFTVSAGRCTDAALGFSDLKPGPHWLTISFGSISSKKALKSNVSPNHDCSKSHLEVPELGTKVKEYDGRVQLTFTRCRLSPEETLVISIARSDNSYRY